MQLANYIGVLRDGRLFEWVDSTGLEIQTCNQFLSTHLSQSLKEGLSQRDRRACVCTRHHGL